MKETFLIKLAGLFKVNLLGTAHKALGIGLDPDLTKNGEEYFLKNLLPKLLPDPGEILIDLGMNKGDYTTVLLRHFPGNQIHGIEANPVFVNKLQERFEHFDNVHIHNVGISDAVSTDKLFRYRNNPYTEHASMNREVLRKLHGIEDIESIDVEMTSLFDLCKKDNISDIGFLKIDIEGYEIKALKGLGDLLDSVKVIQVEFNAMNVFTRVFMYDFYDLMGQFNVYRILPKGILPLTEYRSSLEIFRYQNLVFINKAYDCLAT